MLTNHNEIKTWLDDMLIEDYVINDTGTVTVDGDVHIARCEFTQLPVQFRIVYGDFLCWGNGLETLNGSPREVGGGFYCGGNKLSTLEGGPLEVGGGFYCGGNKLKSLKGSPSDIGGDFDCRDTGLKSLEYGPKEVCGSLYCIGNGFDVPPKTDTIIGGALIWKMLQNGWAERN